MDSIILILFSDIDSHLIEVLKENLSSTFRRSVEVRYKIRKLDSAYDASRNQYISPRLLSRLKRIKRDPTDKILGITDVDLYSPDYDFVYGEADINSGVATLSVFRLSQAHNTIDIDTFEDRAVREAIHEMGHLFGLGHCRNPRCVMTTCTCVEEVDRAGSKFCITCNKEMNTHLLSEAAR
jgi:archaemetzincin